VIEIGRRTRNQAPPARVLYEALTTPNRDPGPLTGASNGTDLTWSLTVNEPEPEPALVGHLRKRVNELINGSLRLAFGQ
jgi:hypothetical protein